MGGGNSMDLNEYQIRASKTDQYPGAKSRAESISLFGLIGEIGSVISTFKKRLRDKEAYTGFLSDLREELGDVLWYLANLAYKYDLPLDDIAEQNLAKTKALFSGRLLTGDAYHLYDSQQPVEEQLPRRMAVTFSDSGEISDAGFRKVSITVNDSKLGASLTDNAYQDDGYRFHDIFHLAFAAVLGWSPVLRRMMQKKRKSSPAVDEVEDGARAAFTEEMIALYTYSYAKDHSFFAGTNQIDEEVLRTIKALVRGLEVEGRTAYEWKTAILAGYRVFRDLRENNGGTVILNMQERSIDMDSSAHG